MFKDALVQLGIVSVSLNTSQEETHFRHRVQRQRTAQAVLRRRSLSARRLAQHLSILPVRLYPSQDQVCNSRTPS